MKKLHISRNKKNQNKTKKKQSKANCKCLQQMSMMWLGDIEIDLLFNHSCEWQSLVETIKWLSYFKDLLNPTCNVLVYYMPDGWGLLLLHNMII